jgi:[protein-PII] uridylyltransferase
VHRFATFVKSERHLNYLYALTVADINATNPTLWNSWRATLLRQLYYETRKMLRRRVESPVDRGKTVRACQEAALERLTRTSKAGSAAIERLWSGVGDEFFLRHSPRQVGDVTQRLVEHDVADGPLVIVQNIESQVAAEGATEIFLYTLDRPNLFASSVIALKRLALSVQDAVIYTAESGVCFNTYVVLSEDNAPIRSGRDRLADELTRMLADPTKAPSVVRQRVPRQLKQLVRPSEARITNTAPGHSTLTILASDRPGLLAQIGLLFVELNITVLSARIATLGDRVEDVFEIQNEYGRPITDRENIYLLENTLRQRLDSMRT